MSEDLRDLSLAQHVARVVFSIAITALVLAGTYFGVRWVFGVNEPSPDKPVIRSKSTGYQQGHSVGI